MRRLAPFLAALAVGCGNLPVTTDGVVALEIEIPASLVLVEGTSRQLVARAYDRNGNEVSSAEIRWHTPDETVSVDELTGIVTALASSGTGRVQASVGSLRSDLLTFTLQPSPDPDPEADPDPDPEPEPDPET
jgi:hypothetical protein